MKLKFFVISFALIIVSCAHPQRPPEELHPPVPEPSYKRLININTATDKDLRTLSGISYSAVFNIIQFRINNGPFRSIEDITKMSGIYFSGVKDQITVGDGVTVSINTADDTYPYSSLHSSARFNVNTVTGEKIQKLSGIGPPVIGRVTNDTQGINRLLNTFIQKYERSDITIMDLFTSKYTSGEGDDIFKVTDDFKKIFEETVYREISFNVSAVDMNKKTAGITIEFRLQLIKKENDKVIEIQGKENWRLVKEGIRWRIRLIKRIL